MEEGEAIIFSSKHQEANPIQNIHYATLADFIHENLGLNQELSPLGLVYIKAGVMCSRDTAVDPLNVARVVLLALLAFIIGPVMPSPITN